MSFYLIRVALARFNAVGIDSPLSKESAVGFFSDFIPEHVIELGADDMSLLLGVSDTLELADKLVTAVDADKVHIKKRREGVFYKVSLVLAHKSLVNENTGELSSDSLTEKSRGNRAVNAARKTQNYLFITDFLTKRADGILDKAFHFPIALAVADIETSGWN